MVGRRNLKRTAVVNEKMPGVFLLTFFYIYMEGGISLIAEGDLRLAIAIMAGGEGQESGQTALLIGPVKR